MKILVVSDIHSNWSALSAIDEDFDICLFVGDLVDYGTNPVPCLEWVSQNVANAVRGNHDHAVAQHVPGKEGPGFRRLAAATRPCHWDQLSSKQLKLIGRLPITLKTEFEGRDYYLVHASPWDPMDEYVGNHPTLWEQRLTDIEADFVLVGHTHLPFHITLDNGTNVVNPGSVGQPRDGDPRCSYAIIEDGNVEIRRVEYDIDATLDQMSKVGIEKWAIELSEAVLTTGGKLTRDEMESFFPVAEK